MGKVMRVSVLSMLLLAAVEARGGFPQADVLIYGRLGGADVGDIGAVWPSGSIPADSVPGGHYLLRIPVEHPGSSAESCCELAARPGDRVQVRVGGQTVLAVTLVEPGEVIRHDLDGSPRPEEELFRRGDADTSGGVNLSDAIFVLDFLFRGASGLVCPDAADSNDDGRVDLTDSVFILGFLFQGGTPLPLPGHLSCGLDATTDLLPACIQSSCAETGGGGAGAGAGAGAGGGGLVTIAAAMAAPVRGDQPRTAGKGSILTSREAAGAAETRPGAAGIAALLVIEPERLDFGAVRPGEQGLKTLTLRNPTAHDLELNRIHADSASFLPLEKSVAVPANGAIQLGVLFRPAATGKTAASLRLGAGVAVSIEGEGAATGAHLTLGDVRVEQASWEAGAPFAVPVTLEGLPERAEVTIELRYPPRGLRVLGLCRTGELESLRLERVEENAGEGTYTGRLQLRKDEKSLDACLLVTAAPGGVPSRLGSYPLLCGRAAVNAIEGLEIKAANGELVVGESPLELDGDSRLELASDLVYARRWARGLPPLPPRFLAIAGVDAAVVEDRLAKLHRPSLALAAGSPVAAERLDRVLSRLAGMAPGKDLPALELARLDFVAWSGLRPVTTGGEAEGPAGDLPGAAPSGIWLVQEEGGRAAAVNLSASADLSTVVIAVDVLRDDVMLTAEAHESSSGIEAIVGADAGAPRRWHVIFQDRLGESWIGRGGSLVGRLSCDVRDASREGEVVALRIVEAAAWSGPRRVSAAFDRRTIEVEARLAQGGSDEAPDGDCDGSGSVDVGDVLALAAAVYGGGPEPRGTCDLDQDGQLTIADIVAAARRALRETH